MGKINNLVSSLLLLSSCLFISMFGEVSCKYRCGLFPTRAYEKKRNSGISLIFNLIAP